jgi:hypothetical protein
MKHLEQTSEAPWKRAAPRGRTLAAPRNPWERALDRTIHGSGLMAEKKTAGKPGRKPPSGAKKQFLTSMDPEIIRRIKSAAALRDKTASLVLEEAAKEWLDRHQNGKK